MAAPAAVLAVKAVLAAASDKRARMVVASVIAGVLMPFILAAIMVLSLLTGKAGHSSASASQTFGSGGLPGNLPADFQVQTGQMQECFLKLDAALDEVNRMADGGAVDRCLAESAFYALFFGTEQLWTDGEAYRGFVECFVAYEERVDEEGKAHLVAVPIVDMETVYGNLSALLGREITDGDKANVQRIYMLATNILP